MKLYDRSSSPKQHVLYQLLKSFSKSINSQRSFTFRDLDFWVDLDVKAFRKSVLILISNQVQLCTLALIYTV